MMIHLGKEATELYERLRKTDDKEEIEKIKERLRELSKQRDEKLKDCPFVH